MLMNVENFIKKVLIMRTAQKDYLKYRFPDLLRTARRFENEVDGEIKEYYKEKADKAQGHFFTDCH